MPNGIPAFSQNTFPNEKPPTLFHPASPKIKPVKPAAKQVNETDAASMVSTSTFTSTVSLLKENVKSKFSNSKTKSTSSISKKQPPPLTYADYLNGEHKTRTLPTSSEEKKEALQDFVLMKK